MFRASIDTSSFNKGISDFRERLSDLRPFFRDEASDLVYEATRRVFQTQGHGTWAPLAPSTVNQRASRYSGRGILRRTDTYFRAATTPTAPGSYRQAGLQSLQIGVKGLNYPIYLERGTSKMPARPVFSTAARRLQRPLLQSLNTYLFRRPGR